MQCILRRIAMSHMPDYRNLMDAANNIEAKRLPLYEHIICFEIMEKILGKNFKDLFNGNYEDKKEFFRNYCEFFKVMGYDTVSFEHCISVAMPGSGSLGRHIEGVIKDYSDFERYPWDEVPILFEKQSDELFSALREVMPEGMKAVGGPGNGIFECVQDIVGYEQLCYIAVDDPELYAALFKKVGETNLKVWKRFMEKHGDMYCVLRFGDDLGFKSSTLISADDIKTHVIPQYANIVAEVHKYNKPFLFHSCGCIFDVMEDMIEIAKINAKHSNEDIIAPFPVWVEKYGDRIGNFGGIDTDAVCQLSRSDMKEYISEVIAKCKGHGGFAFGSGNSIPDYVPVDGYMNMVEIVRELR